MYEISPPRVWLRVTRDAAQFVSEAAALLALGAGVALDDLGLSDAAISLEAGELTNARYQWIRFTEGR